MTAAESETPPAETAAEQRKFLTAVYSVTFAEKILKTFPFDTAVSALRAELQERRVLPADVDEPLFIFEVLDLGGGRHNFVNLLGELPPLREQYPELGSRYEVAPDRSKNLEDLLAFFSRAPRIEPEGFVIHDYTMFDPETLGLAEKRAVIDLISVGGRTLILGSAYQPEAAPPESHIFYIIGGYLAAWALISYFFMRRENLAIPIFVGGTVALLLYLQRSTVGSVKSEIALSSALRSTSIAIAAAALGTSIFLRTSRREVVVVLMMMGFFLAVIPLALSGVSFGKGSLARVNSMIIVQLALSVSCILSLILLILPSANQNVESKMVSPTLPAEI